MKKTSDKVRVTGATDTDGADRLDVDEPSDEAPEPYVEMDECEGDVLHPGDAEIDQYGHVKGEVQAPLGTPDPQGKARKARVKAGSHSEREPDDARDEE